MTTATVTFLERTWFHKLEMAGYLYAKAQRHFSEVYEAFEEVDRIPMTADRIVRMRKQHQYAQDAATTCIKIMMEADELKSELKALGYEWDDHLETVQRCKNAVILTGKIRMKIEIEEFAGLSK